ncbi:restriction endonuclease subunit S [Dehalococcoidia bacterium]|nr:restriction endonuclease subunit S [Dehalococcoidia bacterium]
MTDTTIAPEEFKMTELGPIPCDWEIGMLGSGRYFQILPSGIDNFTGQKKYLSTSSIQGCKIESPECLIYYGNRPSRANMQPRLNTVWFAKMTGTVKVYCFTESNREEVTEYILSTGFCGIRCKEDVDTEYLKFIFLSDYFNTLKDSLCSGTTQRAINNESVSAIQVPLPPLPEQKKIAYVLSSVRTAIEKTEAVINSARELKKSLMKHLFTYGPVSIGEAENVPLKETEIGLVPVSWDVVEVGQLGEIVTGTTPSTSNRAYYGDSYMFVSPGDMGFSKYVRQTQKHLSEKGLSVSRPLPKDTVLVVCIGATIGKTGVTWTQNSITNQQINAIITNSNVLPHYLYYSLTFRSHLLPVLSSRAAVPIVKKSSFSHFPVGLPPLSTQAVISEMLTALDDKIEVEHSKSGALRALFKTLLKNLMTGRTRVNNLEVSV